MSLKVCLNAWKLANFRMPTKVNLHKRGVVLLSLSCPSYGEVDEIEEHLFVQCSVSRRILMEVSSWWGVNDGDIQSIPLLLQWGSSLNLKGDTLKAFTGVYVYLAHLEIERWESVLEFSSRQGGLDV